MLVLLAGAMGLRRGEALALKWEDIHVPGYPVPWLKCGETLQQVTDQGLVILPGKSRWSQRNIAIPKFLADAISDSGSRSYAYKYVCGDVVRDPAAAERQTWYQMRKRLNLDQVRLHDLRHTLVTLLEHQEDLNEFSIRQYIGHSPVGLTQRVYTHMPDGLAPTSVAVAERINKAFDSLTDWRNY
jgi:integrase